MDLFFKKHSSSQIELNKFYVARLLKYIDEIPSRVSEKDENSCLIWIGPNSISLDYTRFTPRRLIYEYCNGEICRTTKIFQICESKDDKRQCIQPHHMTIRRIPKPSSTKSSDKVKNKIRMKRNDKHTKTKDQSRDINKEKRIRKFVWKDETIKHIKKQKIDNDSENTDTQKLKIVDIHISTEEEEEEDATNESSDTETIIHGKSCDSTDLDVNESDYMSGDEAGYSSGLDAYGIESIKKVIKTKNTEARPKLKYNHMGIELGNMFTNEIWGTSETPNDTIGNAESPIHSPASCDSAASSPMRSDEEKEETDVTLTRYDGYAKMYTDNHIHQMDSLTRTTESLPTCHETNKYEITKNSNKNNDTFYLDNNKNIVYSPVIVDSVSATRSHTSVTSSLLTTFCSYRQR